MAGVKGKSGGAREGAGRPAKADEVALIERLSPMDDLAFKALEQGIKEANPIYVKMFFEYRFGKPREKVDVAGGLTIHWEEQKTYAPNDKTD